MANTVPVPIAVGGAVVAVVVVLGGIFLFSGGAGDDQAGQQAGPAPTTRLTFPDTSPSGTEPRSDYPPVPSRQVDGNLVPSARTEGRTLYVPAQDGDCVREEVWPRGEHPDRVEVEVRSLPVPMPPGLTTGADGTASYGCLGDTGPDVPYAVIELAEPLGDRRLVVKHVFPPAPR